MHLLIIPSWYKSEVVPTSGSFFREQAIALQERGHKVGLIYVGFLSRKHWFSREVFKIKSYEDEGVKVYSIILPSFGLTKYEWFNYHFRMKLIKYLYKKYKKAHGKPELIHGHACLMAGYCSVNLGKQEEIPVVITEHSTAFSNGSIKGKNKAYVSHCLSQATAVIAVSQALKQSMEVFNTKQKAIHVIGNMVDLSAFTLPPKKQYKKFRFLAVAYLTQKKGLDVLLKAFAKQFREAEEVELVIGGDGEERGRLEALTQSLKIEKQVHFRGSLSREQVVEEMGQCDVFTLPSRHETFGVVFIEALASGKPIIAARCGGPNDIVNGQNGELVEVDSVEDLSQAMAKLYKNYKSYAPQVIREDCYERFSKEAISEKLEAIYKACLIKNK